MCTHGIYKLHFSVYTILHYMYAILILCIHIYMLYTYSQGIQRVIQEHSRDILQADVYVDLSDKSAETAAALNIASLQ